MQRSDVQLFTKLVERSPADERQRHRLVHGVCIHRIAVIAQCNILTMKWADRPGFSAIGKVDVLRQAVDPRPQLGRRPALAPPPFAVRGQLPIAPALCHPSALIAIVLRSNKLQIALTQQADDNIYECKKPHIVSPFPAPFFLCAFILSDCQSHKQDCAERKCKKGCGAPAKTPRLLK